MQKLFVLAVFAVFVMAFSSYAEDVKYSSHIKGIFDAKCAPCHGGDALEYEEWKKNATEFKAQSVGMKMDTFRSLTAFVVWPNTGALMRRLDNGENTKDKKPGNMYQYLGDTDDERAKNFAVFKSWVPVWKLSRIGDLSKEDIMAQNAIRKKY